MRAAVPHPQAVLLRRLARGGAGLAAAATLLQLSLSSETGEVAATILVAAGFFVLGLRANRTVATAAASTAFVLWWIPSAMDHVGQAAGVPETIASWEVVPLWALALAALAGVWIPRRHRGSRAVTVLICHTATAVAATAAAVFPTAAVTAAVSANLATLIVRGGSVRNWVFRLHRATTRTNPLKTCEVVYDRTDRGWLTLQATTEAPPVYVGTGGQLAVLHTLPAGRVSLECLDDDPGQLPKAYALNGSVSRLAELLTAFALADRDLAHRIGQPPASVTTLVDASRARLQEVVARLDLAGIWDEHEHRYADHPVVMVTAATVAEQLAQLDMPETSWVVRRRYRRRRESSAEGGWAADARQRQMAELMLVLPRQSARSRGRRRQRAA
ncbi:hypothetical protein [Streptomyces sp. NPDC051572]|uniref:hypothetical protein n=1 Tax=Streptomyces sp. NPDC051572 TaxID=3155802 RepID=UPI003450163E